MIMVDGEREESSIDFINEVLLLVMFGLSVPLVFIAFPYGIKYLCRQAKVEKCRLVRKVAEIELLPKARYLSTVHTAMNFCTICTSQFVHGHSYVSFLPCDARHYFHSKCVRAWLLGKHPGCPLCQVPVDFEKSIEVDQ
mmetsp:Transcript_23722/g.29458  ORF Transcript_23722/g.29458 Transcript_23722/m.29458 type:complete len:139 (+) Transcript_23722:527-943(+)